jgi:hypothetical protein
LAQLPLELADLCADPGLADMGTSGRPGEVCFFGHRHEVLKLSKFHSYDF